MRKAALLFCAICLAGASAFGPAFAPAFAKDADKDASSKAAPAVTKEQRDKMADAHEKMASCLRSDKSMDECRKQMRSSCQEMAKAGGPGCPMMGGMGMHHGMSGKSGQAACPCANAPSG